MAKDTNFGMREERPKGVQGPTLGPRQEVLGIPVGGTGTLQGNVESLHNQLNNFIASNPVTNNRFVQGMFPLVGGFMQGFNQQKGAVKAKPAGVPEAPNIPGAGAIGSVADPKMPDPNAMALQMFFTQTIAPYLNQLRASMTNNAQMAGTAMQQTLPHVNPALRPFFNPQARQAQVQSLADALAAGTAAGPTLDQLMANIRAAEEAQRFHAYELMRQRSVGEQADVMSLLGQAESLFGDGEKKKGK